MKVVSVIGDKRPTHILPGDTIIWDPTKKTLRIERPSPHNILTIEWNNGTRDFPVTFTHKRDFVSIARLLAETAPGELKVIRDESYKAPLIAFKYTYPRSAKPRKIFS